MHKLEVEIHEFQVTVNMHEGFCRLLDNFMPKCILLFFSLNIQLVRKKQLIKCACAHK